MSFFELEMLPRDPILGLPIIFAADPRKEKVNLGIGAYRTSEGKPFVLSAVKKAEKLVVEKDLTKEYLPIDGDSEFNQGILKLIFGTSAQKECIFPMQTIGGSGALRTAGEFFLEISHQPKVFIPQPSWANHQLIFRKSKLHVDYYPYYHPVTHRLDFSGMCTAIQAMPPKSMIVLHACCHNPTGIDPTFEQWKELSYLIKKQGIIPLFDNAYQGFGKDLSEDVQSIRYFFEQGHEMFIAHSCSKNFGLYGERVGLLALVANDQEIAIRAGTHLRQIVRGNYSTPPLHGARIVSTILQSQALKDEWQQELKLMRERVQEMRVALVLRLTKAQKNDFRFMNDQNGIFSYTGLMPNQVDILRNEYGIYMTQDGRINIAGLNQKNLDYVIQSIIRVL